MGSVVHFLEAPLSRVLSSLSDDWELRATGIALTEALPLMLPFEAPWTRLLAAECGGWTALINNFLHGGDSTAPSPALSRRLGVRCVVASCVPTYGPGHSQTQLELFGPTGQPPLLYVRSISATATDGRWTWFSSGDPLEFEQADRYSARRIRDRFDRPLLLEYLTALGIPADRDASYGTATLAQQQVDFRRREMSLREARSEFSKR